MPSDAVLVLVGALSAPADRTAPAPARLCNHRYVAEHCAWSWHTVLASNSHPQPTSCVICRAPNSVRWHVANKSDLKEERAVTEEEGKEAAEAHGVSHYCETSAKTNEGIDGA